MTDLVLYSTLGCHLCERALEIVEPLCAERALAIREVEIADDPTLMDTYGVRIPVIRDLDTDREIGWPFDAHAMGAWLDPLG